ncbi:MAG: hypothetical protein ACXVCY_03070 [Pseudobdellovibrionaceae bacterium]
MKFLSSFALVVFVLCSGLQAQAFLKCKSGDSETVNFATELFNKTQTLFTQGAIEKSKVVRANIFVNEAKLCSQTFSTKEFCDATMPLLTDYNGRTLEDRREAISLLAEGKVICEN